MSSLGIETYMSGVLYIYNRSQIKSFLFLLQGIIRKIMKHGINDLLTNLCQEQVVH